MAVYGIYEEEEELLARLTAPVSVRSNVPVKLVEAISTRRSGTSHSAQRWEIVGGLEPLSSGAHKLMSSAVVCGLSERVDVLVPQTGQSVARRSGTSPVAVSDAAAGSSQVTVPVFSGLIPKGTFLRFSGGTKVYVATADRDGPGVLPIFPPLRASLESSYVSFGDDVFMSCFYDKDSVQGMSYSDGILMGLPARLIEAIPYAVP